MKVIFMGTPDFAVGTFQALLKAGHEIVLAVTQPDKAKGRSGKLQFPPVKEAAVEAGVPVFQPVKIREAENIEYLKQFDADMIVVVAFGQILPKEILDMPKYCCVNVHASLLPKYRGAAPIQWVILDGEKETGVTTMRMDEGLDTGDMIMKEVVPLTGEETGGSLFDQLCQVGADLCVKTLEAIENGTAIYTPQDHSQANITKIIKKSLGQIQWDRTATSIEQLIRGLNPWPSAYTSWHGKTLKIWSANVESEIDGVPEDLKAGMVALVTKKDLIIKTGQGYLALTELQLEGKKRMPVDAFLRGNQIVVGEELGKNE